MSLMVDILGLDDPECHLQCQWQRVTEYVYCTNLRIELFFMFKEKIISNTVLQVCSRVRADCAGEKLRFSSNLGPDGPSMYIHMYISNCNDFHYQGVSALPLTVSISVIQPKSYNPSPEI